MDTKLKVALDAVKEGSKLALSHFGDHTFQYKEDRTPVTETDTSVEKIIREVISHEFPDANFLGEELGGSKDEKSFWSIDPIDGTRSFIRGIPLWGILLAYVEEGEVLIGISAVPSMGEILYAQKGKGAYLNEKEVHVSETFDLKESFITYGRPTYFENKEGLLKLIGLTQGARGIGDAYSYHLLASGRIDVNIEAKIKLDDVAPFKVIIEEAGGKVTNFEGKPWGFGDPKVIASNGKLHEEVMEILKG